MIKQSSVQLVLETVRVEEVVGDFVNLRRRGVNMIGLCPFHNEKTPSFNVNPARNIYKCFGCGRGGDAVSFLMEHEHLDFPESIRWLARKYGIKLEEVELSPEIQAEQQERESLFLINQFARDYFQEQLFDTDRGRSVGLSYFKQRGFREDTIRHFGLGYAPAAGDALLREAVAHSYDKDKLEQLGLTKNGRDFFRDRVMFAIHNLSGKVIGFGGRILQKDAKAPKYINSPETEIYTKSKVLYGAYFAKQAIRREDVCILTEGYTDVISLHQAGIDNVVASSGTSLTVDQTRLIKRYTANVLLLFDGDPAGIKAALRGVDILLEQDLNVKVVLLPTGEDPDSYLQQVGVTVFREYLANKAKDFILFKANLLLDEAGNDPVKRAGLIKDIVNSVGLIPDPFKRSIYLKECARLFGVEEQLLVAEANKVVGGRLKKFQQEQAAPTVGESAPAPATIDPPQETEANIGHGFQERELARVLITFGHQLYDKVERISVAEHIIDHIEEFIEEIDEPLYRQVVLECRQLVEENEPLHPTHFLNHPEEALRRLAIDFLSTPYVYSDNWEKRHGVVLNQLSPEDNFIKDCENTLRHFRLRKVQRLCERNKQTIDELFRQSDMEKVALHLRLQQKLKEIERELSLELGRVVGR